MFYLPFREICNQESVAANERLAVSLYFNNEILNQTLKSRECLDRHFAALETHATKVFLNTRGDCRIENFQRHIDVFFR
jgi:hypothetical protein